MKVKCTKCSTILKIDETKFTTTTILIACPNCQQQMRVNVAPSSIGNEVVNSELVVDKSSQPKAVEATDNSITTYIATTDEFWKTFHESLAYPYSWWHQHKSMSLDNWIEMCKNTPDIISHINFLFKYSLLKNEFVIVYYKGIILTNYRLLIDDKVVGSPSIPLNKIKSYDSNSTNIIEYEKNNQIVKLQYKDTNPGRQRVNDAIARNEIENLNETQLMILQSPFYELNEKNSSINIPKVITNQFTKDKSTIDVNSLSRSSDINPLNKLINKFLESKFSKTRFYTILVIAASLFFFIFQSTAYNTSAGMMVFMLAICFIVAFPLLFILGLILLVIYPVAKRQKELKLKPIYLFSTLIVILVLAFDHKDNSNDSSSNSTTKEQDYKAKASERVNELIKGIDADNKMQEQGYVKCPTCGGMGKVANMYGNYQVCNTCRGIGYYKQY